MRDNILPVIKGEALTGFSGSGFIIIDEPHRKPTEEEIAEFQQYLLKLIEERERNGK